MRKLLALVALLISTSAPAQVLITLAGTLPQVSTPIFSPPATTYGSTQTVIITSATPGASIYYTLDGSPPTAASTLYTSPLVVATSEQINAIAIAANYANSTIATGFFTINQAPTGSVIYTPVAGTYTSAQTVALSSVTPGATIYYTADGSTPTTSSAVYSGPLLISVTTTLLAIAKAPAYSQSPVVAAIYTIHLLQSATPILSPGTNNYNSVQTVTMTDATAGASIYYTTDGSTPTTGSTLYTVPITVSVTQTIKAIAAAAGFTNSAVASATYTITIPAANPVITPAAGQYTTSVTVTITDSCAGSTIYYTTNNTTPTTGSPVYAGPFTLTTSANVQAMATCTGFAQSFVVMQNYTIVPPQQAPTPTFAPNSTTSSTPIVVAISDTAPAASIYYCTAIAPATCTPTPSSTSYTGPITVSSTETVFAMATAAGYSNSATGSATYTISAVANACPQSSGTITTAAKVTLPAGGTSTVSTSGTSPLLIFFDATGTTDSSITGNNTAFQDDTYTWSFGDSGASGTGTWGYGSNPGKNSKNSATGAVGAHVYVVTADTTFTPQLTVTNGTSTVVCNAPPVTVYAPTDASPNGFGGVLTTCASSSTTPVAGSGGCPAGATVLKTAAFSGALNATFMGSNKRVLFLCGDTFTQGGAQVNGTHFSIGAYGGCEGTASNRPILQVSPTGSGITVGGGSNSIDGRIADLDFEGTTALTTGNVGSNNAYAMFFSVNSANTVYPSQQLIYNVNSNNNDKTWSNYNGTQIGLVQVSMQTSGQNQGIYFNTSGNQCYPNASVGTAFCGGFSYNPLNYFPIEYNAMMGSYLNAAASVNLGSGPENTRVSACRFCVFSYDTFLNATTTTAVFKFHDASRNEGIWTGQYNEYGIITDNLFGGLTGSQIVEVSPENPVLDERNRLSIIERNIFTTTKGGRTGLALSSTNTSARDNACYNTGQNCIQPASRGIEPQPMYDEIYNNSCNTGGPCVDFVASFWASAGKAGTNSIAANILCFSTSGCVTAGAGNTASNYTSNTALNPGFVNGSSSFMLMPDWIPTANYSGGTSVPVFYDALGNLWSPTWALGADSSSGTPTTVNFFTQPTVTGAAGNTYMGGRNGFNYGGVWMLDSVEPATCAGGSDPSGLFTTTFNPVALTGLSSTTGNLSYSSGTSPCTSPQSAASTVQATATSMGTYINSQDVGPIGGISKMGMFPEIWGAKPSTSPTGLTFPFVNYNGIQINFWAQVPTATWPGMPALGNTSSTGAAYAAFDLGLEDLNGNQIVFDAGFFFGGEPAETSCKPPVQDNQGGTAWELKCQIASGADANPYTTANVGYMTWLAGTFSSTVFSGYVQYTYNITQANFQQALNDIKSNGANVPANFSTDPNTWGFLHGHFNDECYFISAPCSLGTSEHDLTINLF